MRLVRGKRLLAVLLGLFLLAPAALTPAPAAEPSSPVLNALQKELTRSFQKLKNSGEAPLYYLSYSLYDVERNSMSAHYGALEDTPYPTRSMKLRVNVRVGDQHIDNTHKMRRSSFSFSRSSAFNWFGSSMPAEPEEYAIRSVLWQKTDEAFKEAEQRFLSVKANKDVSVEDEDTSDDFSQEKSHAFVGSSPKSTVDMTQWQNRIRELSKIYKKYPEILNSDVSFVMTRVRRYMVASDDTRLQDDHTEFRFATTAEATADDGMRVWLYDSVEVPNYTDIPDEPKLAEMVEHLAQSVKDLRQAQKAEPYVGPAILQAKAAGVFFHETFGHRIEGNRQKDEEEGRTFAKKVGHQIMPNFITVIDDPTIHNLGTKPLHGYYSFDDEGIPAQKVTLVENGTLKGFLMGRSPVRGFPASNGHGRGAPGNDPVARQGNLIVKSSKRVPYAELRKMLIEEAKKQGKPYGLVFDEIAGGFTLTSTWLPQVYRLLPLRVTRVYTDGRPDELLRGVNIVGTPLASLENILAAADDDAVFNGTCDAESGPVPVSACAPSLLVQTIEVERQDKSTDKPPILPPPAHDKGGAAK
ncbi:MAG: metallopeptidase TldD-related protein [Candidatus Obscuribacterales bacterium]